MEIHLALHQTLYQERQLQQVDRKAAAWHRSTGSSFRAEVAKSNKEERRWRIETDKCRASTCKNN